MRFFPLLLLPLLLACGSKTEPAAPAAAATPPAPDSAQASTVSLTPAQVRAGGLEIGGFTWQNMSSAVSATGTIDVPPANHLTISAPLGGTVQAIDVLPGQAIKRGATVAVLRDPAFLKLQQDYLQSRARVTFLRQELERQRTLNAEDVGARRKLEQATADFQTETAAERSLAGQLRLLGLSPEKLAATGVIQPTVALTTPHAGYVVAVSANPGQYVAPNAVLVEVVDRSDLHLQLKVFEKDVARVQVGQPIRFTVPARGAMADREGTVFLVGKAFDPGARTVEVHGHLAPGQPDDLLPGQFVNARIQVGDARQRTLPEDALVRHGDVSYVFGQEPASPAHQLAFRQYRVRAGASANGYVTITPLDPIADTTRLVRRGAYVLVAEMSKGSDE